LNVLEEIAQIAKDIPPVDNAASRFGNPAFRTFYDKVSDVRKNILRFIWSI
jgi:serine/threonine-protein phosphatase 2A activator